MISQLGSGPILLLGFDLKQTQQQETENNFACPVCLGGFWHPVILTGLRFHLFRRELKHLVSWVNLVVLFFHCCKKHVCFSHFLTACSVLLLSQPKDDYLTFKDCRIILCVSKCWRVCPLQLKQSIKLMTQKEFLKQSHLWLQHQNNIYCQKKFYF